MTRWLSPFREFAHFFFSRLILKASRDIELHSSWLAGQSTATYVIDNLSSAAVFKSRDDILGFSVQRALERESNDDGMFLEFGVYSGSSINQISALAKDRIVYGFDSFEGLPEDWRQGYPKGSFATAPPVVREKVELIRGWFDQSLPKFLTEHQRPVNFLHIDCDLYSSTKTVLNLLSDRIIPGTIIAFDEYFNYPGWQKGEFAAFQEFVSSHSVRYRYLAYTKNNEQCVVEIL